MSSQGEVLPAFFLPLILDSRALNPQLGGGGAATPVELREAAPAGEGRSRESPGSLCRGNGVELGESLAGSGMIGIAPPASHPRPLESVGKTVSAAGSRPAPPPTERWAVCGQ